MIFRRKRCAGALPRDQNTPQRPAFGLYVEELNGTAFTAPRGVSRSTWTYRIRPSAVHKPFRPIGSRLIRSGPFNEVPPTPNQLRWRPLPIPTEPTDFVDGIVTLGGNGDPATQSGAAIHVYAANRPMTNRFFYNADGELLIVPQSGTLTLHTELGVLDVPPGHVALVPRGIKFRVELPDGSARGIHLRELRTAPAPARSRTDRHLRPGERARLHGAGRGLRGSRRRLPRRRQVRRRSLGSRDRSLAARHRRVARQLRAVQVRLVPLSVHQHGDLRSPRSRRSTACSRRRPPCRARRTSSSDVSRRAGRSPSTRSVRRRFIATSPASSWD